MEKKAAVICGTAGLLGILAAILGFVGEGTKTQSFSGFNGEHCVYRNTPALGCGVVGALFILAAHVILSAATGCCGCCRPETRKMIPSQTKRIFAVAMSVVSWILLIIAMGLFFVGTMWNIAGERKPAEATTSSGAGECYVLQGGVFAAASVLSLVIVGFGVASYFLLRASEPSPPQQQPGIAMGQPAPYFTAEGGYPMGATWETRA
uniref:Uncharacterized protein n=1 Tax=Avena sativa TaxID=4498 RepID=A0ACD5YUT1_AVESA